MRIHDHNKIFKKKIHQDALIFFCIEVYSEKMIRRSLHSGLFIIDYIVNHGVLMCHSRAMQSCYRATLLITDRSRERLIFHWEYYHRSFKLQIVIEI